MLSGSPAPGAAQHLDYRPAVDGLRGVAVLAVLGFHAFPEYVPGGFVGVDVFFVISGFLITSIIARELTRDDFSITRFYMRRVRRLFPALVLVLFVSLAIGWAVLMPDEFMQLGKHVAASALFVVNFAFWRESGYFDAAAELKPLLHIWSLGIEEQFYLVWPWMLMALWSRRALLLGVLSLLVLGSFVLSVVLAHEAPVANFYLPFSRFWELGVGCILALKHQRSQIHGLPRRGLGRLAHASSLLSLTPIFGLACIIASVLFFDEGTPFPSWPALLPVLGTLLILATPETSWSLRHVLGSAVLVWIGLISYGLYLWHWPLLSFASIIEAGSLPTPVRWLALLLSFVLAWLSYSFVEKPVRRRRGHNVIRTLIASSATVGIAGLVVYFAGGVGVRYDDDLRALAAGPRVESVCRDQMPIDWDFNYCRATSTQAPKIIFLGDSRAHALYEAMVPMLPDPMLLLGRGGCPPLLNVRISGHAPNEEDCDEIWHSFVRHVQEVRPEVVVVVGNGSFLVRDAAIRLSYLGPRELSPKVDILEQGISDLITELARPAKVIFVGELPTFPTSPSCFLRKVRLPTTRCSPTIDRGQIEQVTGAYDAVLRRLQRVFPQVVFLDPVAALCDERICSQQFGGGPILYSDPVHLSPAGARLLVERTGLTRLIMNEMTPD